MDYNSFIKNKIIKFITEKGLDIIDYMKRPSTVFFIYPIYPIHHMCFYSFYETIIIYDNKYIINYYPKTIDYRKGIYISEIKYYNQNNIRVNIFYIDKLNVNYNQIELNYESNLIDKIELLSNIIYNALIMRPIKREDFKSIHLKDNIIYIISSLLLSNINNTLYYELNSFDLERWLALENN